MKGEQLMSLPYSFSGDKPVIQLKFNDLLREKEYRDKRHISLRSIHAETNLSMGTLLRFSQDKVDRVSIEVMEALCAFFDLQSVGDLFEYTPNPAHPADPAPDTAG